MADLSSVTDNYLPTASETFADNLSGSISAGATTVPVNSAVEYPDGATVVLTVDPGTALEATFVGKKDTGADQFIECIWTEGNTAVGHDAGATIIDYDSATHYNLLSEALQLIMNQDGTLKDDPIRTALGLSDASNDGWEVFPYTFSVSSGYNKGQKEFDLTVANQDVTSLLSVGMKLRLERSTTAPTQCADLEASSSQYAAKTSPAGLSFTNNFSAEAWIKPESIGSRMGIVARRNADTEGFSFQINTFGQIELIGLRIAGNNRYVSSYVAVVPDKWQHVAATLDMSGNTGSIYLNGVSLPIFMATNGTATALVQGTTALVVGAEKSAGTNPFDGKIADVRVWDAIRTATQFRDNMNQQLVGNETNLVAYFKLNGNLNDSTANANNLTGSGGAVATDVDNPMKSTEYAVVTKVAYSAPNSTVTIFTGTDHAIPNMTLTSPYYSVQKTPYGFPTSRDKWSIISWIKTDINNGASTADTFYNTGSFSLSVPVGAFEITAMINGQATTGGNTHGFLVAIDTVAAAGTNYFARGLTGYAAPSPTDVRGTVPISFFKENTSQSLLYVNICSQSNNATALYLVGGSGPCFVRAECAYI